MRHGPLTERMRPTASRSLPRLGIAHGDRGAPALQVAEAAAGLCEIVWLVDARDAAVARTGRLLGRLGQVVDVAGSPAREAAGVLAPLRLQGIATFYDTGLLWLAEVASLLGLDFHSPAVARALAGKACQRECLRAAGVPVPWFRAVQAPPARDVADELARTAPYPVVLKPSRGSGSFHTYRVEDAATLSRLLASVPAGEMVVEAELRGAASQRCGGFADYLSVESVASGGELRHLALTGRLPVAAPYRETGFFVPAALPPDRQGEVLDCASAAIEALGVRQGALHTEVKLTDEGPRVIEVNGRAGGGVADLVRLAGSELSLYRLALRVALGEDVEPALAGSVIGPPTGGGPGDGYRFPRVGYRFFYQPPAGARRLIGLEGLEELGRAPGVAALQVNRPVGAELDARLGTRNHLFSLWGSADDHDGVLAMASMMQATVRARYATATPGEPRA